MASQSRSQRRRQQQRARAQQRPTGSAQGRAVEKRPAPPQADLAAPADTTVLADDEAEGLATPAVEEEVALPVSPARSEHASGVGRVTSERETAASASSRRPRRSVRPAAEPVDYTLDYEIARHDLRRIAILATLLLAAMVALRVSGVL
jgi:hypothetical protein